MLCAKRPGVRAIYRRFGLGTGCVTPRKVEKRGLGESEILKRAQPCRKSRHKLMRAEAGAVPTLPHPGRKALRSLSATSSAHGYL